MYGLCLDYVRVMFDCTDYYLIMYGHWHDLRTMHGLCTSVRIMYEQTLFFDYLDKESALRKSTSGKTLGQKTTS